jgi:predicted alpha/beta hydrolase
MSTTLRLHATDGYALGARKYGEQQAGPYVVLCGATAVKQSYYTRFAAWLSLEGFTVLSFDYRGVGESRPARLRGFEATMRDWGERDLEGVLRFAREDGQGRPLFLVGHSVGGQLLGLAESSRHLERVVTVGSQSGYWGHWRGASALRKAAVWYGLIPFVGAALGYVPGRLGLGEDLPAGVALEWARWCRTPDYLFGHGVAVERYQGLRCALLSVSVDDDDYAPRQAVDWLHARYVNADVERVHVTPRELGASSVGHFGFFRAALRDSAWPMVASFLRGRARPVSTGEPATPDGPSA